jgi:hypothetical protein
MISSEVQRTLVKSPPELWAEISDPDALARHLGEFGEIRITRVEPEQRVEWQAGDTTGSVVIKPSGWGTKVKLTVTRELAESEAGSDAGTDAVAEPEVQPQVAAEGAQVGPSEPEHPVESRDEPEPRGDEEAALPAGAELEPSELEQAAFERVEPDDVAVGQADDHAQHQAAPEPRRGFFARLFGRRRATRAAEPIDERETPSDAAPQAIPSARYNALAVWASQIEADAAEGASNARSDVHAASGAHAETEQEVAQAPPGGETCAETPLDRSPSVPASPDAPSQKPGDPMLGEEDTRGDVSAEIREAEEVAAEQVTAVLSGVLDRLGAAHHRPFSRA